MRTSRWFIKNSTLIIFSVLVLIVSGYPVVAQLNPDYPIVSIGTSPNGRYMAVLQAVPDDPGALVSIIDAETLSITGQIPIRPVFAGNTISVADDGAKLVYATSSQEAQFIQQVDVTTGEIIGSGGSSAFGINWLLLNKDGTLAVFPEASSIRLIDFSAGKGDEVGFGQLVVSASWSPVDDRLAVVSSSLEPDLFDGATVQIVDIQSSADRILAVPLLLIEGGGGMVAWNPDGERIAVGRNQGFDIYNSSTGELLSQFELSLPTRLAPGPLAWSMDGTKIAGGVEDGVAVWDVASGEQVALYPAQLAMALAWRSDGSLVQVAASAFLNEVPITISDVPVTPVPTPTPTHTPTPTPTPIPTATPTPAAFQKLRLTSMCSANPAATRRWRVRNPNPYPVTFTWDVYNSPNRQRGSGVVPAAVGGVQGEVLFSTVTEAGPNTVRLFVNGAQQDVKASGGATCS